MILPEIGQFDELEGLAKIAGTPADHRQLTADVKPVSKGRYKAGSGWPSGDCNRR